MARRGNDEGTIVHRRDGLFEARWWVETPAGKRRRSAYAKTRKEAAEKLAQALAQRGRGLAFDAANLTLSEYLRQWLKSSVKGSVKAVTFEAYERTVRLHVIPALGSVRLAKLSPAHLQNLYQEKLNAGLAPSSVRLMHAVISRALRQAHRWRLVAENAAAVTVPPRPAPEEMRPLDAAQAKALLSAARGHRLEALFVLAITAGLRIGELLGLRWEDLDFERGTLRVRRTLSGAKGGPRFTPPKSGKGRQIRLAAQAVDALKRHRAAQNAERLKMGGGWNDEGLVFCTATGAPLRRGTVFQGSFKPLLERAGLPKGTRLHNLRHTCATLLLAKGVHPKLVQELLGHSSVAMTLDRYSHVMPGMGDQTAAAMQATLFS
jgi:integrase